MSDTIREISVTHGFATFTSISLHSFNGCLGDLGFTFLCARTGVLLRRQGPAH